MSQQQACLALLDGSAMPCQPTAAAHMADAATAPAWHVSLLERQAETWGHVRERGEQPRTHLGSRATYVLADAIEWLSSLPPNSIHAVVTDPPYGVVEYEDKDHDKLRRGKGGVWRIPPSFDGAKRRPLPRFTVLSQQEMATLQGFFGVLAEAFMRVLVPGGHIVIASNPLLSTTTFPRLSESGPKKSAASSFAWCKHCAAAIGRRAPKTSFPACR